MKSEVDNRRSGGGKRVEEERRGDEVGAELKAEEMGEVL